jgi:hypothetical protein
MTARFAILTMLSLTLAATTMLPTRASAQVEIEVDPVAYAMNGYSLHVARILGATRLNVGVFGIDVPHLLHGNDGWSSRMRGAGVKWDYLGDDANGFFVGVEGGYMRMRYTLDAESARENRDVVGVGLRAGYRVPIGRSGLYVVPWAAVSYSIDGDDVVIGASTFDRSPVAVYPLLHIGWSF